MNQHRYESLYQLNRAMWIRKVRGGLQLDQVQTYQDRYSVIRANMDLHPTVVVVRMFLTTDNRKNDNLVWLAWGHKSQQIQKVGLGEYSWPRPRVTARQRYEACVQMMEAV